VRRRRKSYVQIMALDRQHKNTLRKMQANQCCWCGKPMQAKKSWQWDYETIEHLMPLSKGGSHEMSNLALAHKKCNQERGIEDREPLLRRVARRFTNEQQP